MDLRPQLILISSVHKNSYRHPQKVSCAGAACPPVLVDFVFILHVILVEFVYLSLLCVVDHCWSLLIFVVWPLSYLSFLDLLLLVAPFLVKKNYCF
jgi:hypothetical protein